MHSWRFSTFFLLQCSKRVSTVCPNPRANSLVMFWLLKGFVSFPSLSQGTMTRIDLKQKVQNDESHSDSFWGEPSKFVFFGGSWVSSFHLFRMLAYNISLLGGDILGFPKHRTGVPSLFGGSISPTAIVWNWCEMPDKKIVQSPWMQGTEFALCIVQRISRV